MSQIESRRSFRLGVLNGAIFEAGDGFIDSNTVIPVFLSRLTTSNALIGLASSFTNLGWLLPQIFVAPWIARFPRQMWLYRRAATVRATALALLAALVWPLSENSPALLTAFFICYGVYSFGAGFGGVPFMEIVGRTVPAGRLGSFWSQRMFWGGLLGAGAGLIVREVLKLEDLRLKFTILFGTALVLVSTAYALFSSIREPPSPPASFTTSPWRLLGEGVGLLRRDAIFRRLLLSRSVLSIWLAASPFIVLFAVRDLRGSASAAGTFLLARLSGSILANLMWQRLSHRRGNRAIMRIATLACAANAFAATCLALASPWWLGWISAGAAVIGLEVVTFFGGAAQTGLLVGYASLVIELAPLGRRQVFVSLMNTFVGPTMLLPAVAGALVDWINAPVVFAACAVAAFLGSRAAARLPDSSGAVTEAPEGSTPPPAGPGP